MSLLRLMNQGITAPKEVALVHEAIALHEEELISFESAFENTKRKLKNISASVDILHRQYSYVEQVLEVHKRDLEAHEQGNLDLRNLKKTLVDEGDGLESSFLVGLPPFPDQSSSKQEAISMVIARLGEIQNELHAKLHIQRVWQNNVEGMELYRQNIRFTIGGLKAAFGPINKVPAEVWILVFRHRLIADIEDYTQSPGSRSYHSTAVTLGQVSSLWRGIVHTRKDLWKYFICGPGQIRIADQVERWKYTCSFGHQDMTFICNLQARPPSPFIKEETTLAQEVMASTSHSIHLLCASNQKELQAVDLLPFKHQLSLTLQMNGHATAKFFDDLAPYFPSFSSLTISQVDQFSVPNPDFYKRRNPPVEVLTLDLGSFTPFRIDYYCEESLAKEIHILHNGINYVTGRSESCPLVRVVGITPPDTSWLDGYKLPTLHRLILYGPKLHTIAAPSLVDLSQHPYFHNVKELEIRRWPVYNPTDGESWSILPLVLAIADRLRFIETIRCADSFIDGKSMTSVVKYLKETRGDSIPSKLKNVVIDCCSGITRDDCDSIAASVEKLEVYV